MVKKLKFSFCTFLIFIFSIHNLWANSKFAFSYKDKIHISSDKGYRYGLKGQFKAEGNVIILHKDLSLYGEKALLDFKKNTLRVEGNVRLITPESTLYGSLLIYNLDNNKLIVHNGKILTKDYSVSGEIINRIDEKNYTGKNVEYSTCLDCVKSWSIYGKKVELTINEYIHIHGAVIMSKEVPFLYIPYIVLPVKKARTTGLLFPKIIFSSLNGLFLKQPWFWAINNNSDMTIAPWNWDKKGKGADIEFRLFGNDRNWASLQTVNIWDSFYENPDIESPEVKTHYYRNYSALEGAYNLNDRINFFAKYDFVKERDIFDEYYKIVSGQVSSADIGFQSIGFYRGDKYFLQVELDHRRFLLNNKAIAEDRSFVQRSPRVLLSVLPFMILEESPVLSNLAIGGELDATRFRQETADENDFIGNIDRYKVGAKLNYTLFKDKIYAINGTLFNDYFYYDFPKNDKSTNYYKRNDNYLENSFSLKWEKVIGKAYSHKDKLERKATDKQDQKEIERNSVITEEKKNIFIGSIPEVSRIEKAKLTKKQSYKHVIDLFVNHYYTFDEYWKGNNQFNNQVQSNSGILDLDDISIGRKNLLGSVSNRTEISKLNSLELKLINSLIGKSPNYLENNQSASRNILNTFSYGQLGRLVLSQGFDLKKRHDSFKDFLSRFHLGLSLPIDNYVFDFSHYYFYDSGESLNTLKLSKDFGTWGMKLSFVYQSVKTPDAVKNHGAEIYIRPTELLKMSYGHVLNMKNGDFYSRDYNLDYNPVNNCWKLNLNYKILEREKSIAVNFFVNFGDNKFLSLFNPSQLNAYES